MRLSSMQASKELKANLDNLKENKEDYEDVIWKLISHSKPLKEVSAKSIETNRPCGNKWCGRSVAHICKSKN